jgi:hypothetical protein
MVGASVNPAAQAQTADDAYALALQESGQTPPEPQTKPGIVSRILGPTAGSQAGNARAILAFVLTIAFVGLLVYLTVQWLQFGRSDAKDLVLAGWGALGSAFTLIVGLYFGRRSAESG